MRIYTPLKCISQSIRIAPVAHSQLK